MPSPTQPSAFACAAPLRESLRVARLERAACAQRNAGARRARGGERACALPADNVDDKRAVGKARAAAILARELPWMLSFRRGRGETIADVREPLGGGVGELFARNVEFNFPVGGAGKGRWMLKMLLMSLPLQANVGMLYPTVDGLVITSPSADSLNLNYSVRCSVLRDKPANASWGIRTGRVFGDFTEAELGPKETLVHVRTRLRFSDQGRIISWIDTWNKSVPEVLEDIAVFSEPPEESSYPEENELERGASSGSRPVGNAKRVQGSIRCERSGETVDVNDSALESAFHADDWLLEDEDRDKAVSNGWRPSDGDDGRAAGRRLADAIVPTGPPLSPADARSAALRVADYLREDFARHSLPGGGGDCSNPIDLSEYSLFHSDAILETPTFVSEGAESLALLHALARADTWFRFAKARIVCTETRIEAPRVVVARYIMRARGRLAGGLVQKSSYVKLRLNAAGEIVHCELSVESVKDDCLPLFGRTKRWLWLG